jgi:hypothetical protein
MMPSNIITYMNGVEKLVALILLSGRLISSSFWLLWTEITLFGKISP